MRRTAGVVAALALPLSLLGVPGAALADTSPLDPRQERQAREVLGDRDGWAAYGGGTSGGSQAAPEDVHVVRDWAEFRDALGDPEDDTPRIVAVAGVIDANTDAQGDAVACEDYADPEFDFDAYLETYAPENWGWEEEPSGPLEEARARSVDNQQEQIEARIGSNTTVIGLGDDATIRGASVVAGGVDNVIVRNLTFENTFDCWPQWDPTDGSEGAWNAEFDNLSVRDSRNVWLDHNAFSDAGMPDSELPEYFGQEYQMHDGLVDITNGADLVTASYNVFSDHDKTMLIGSTDSPTYDVGKLRVTLHHNRWENILQRAPRVRWGQVHVYNNHYVVPLNPEGDKQYLYSWGVGHESQLYAENNYFDIDPGIAVSDVVADWRGTEMEEHGTLLNGRSPRHQVSMLAEHNAVADEPLGDSVGWDPTLHERIAPTQAVPWLVRAHAGPGRL